MDFHFAVSLDMPLRPFIRKVVESGRNEFSEECDGKALVDSLEPVRFVDLFKYVHGACVLVSIDLQLHADLAVFNWRRYAGPHKASQHARQEYLLVVELLAGFFAHNGLEDLVAPHLHRNQEPSPD